MTIKEENKVPSRQWLAKLTLEFGHNAYGTQLKKTTRKGPLSVQKAFYPEGQECAHIYLLHPPAGIVSGDELTVEIAIEAKGHVLVTTPGANRFYRAREDLSIGESKQTQVTSLSLDEQAVCENFPQETIVYEGADGFNTVDIHMNETSVYLGWDITCLGLPSSDQYFNKGQYTQLNRLYCGDTLIYHDRIEVSPRNKLLHHMAGLASNPVFGTILIYAPVQLTVLKDRKHIVEELRHIIETNNAQSLISITDIHGLFVIRYLGEQAHQCKQLFIILWQHIRPLVIDAAAIEPRIWHT
jgi:urease accessory protein